MSEKQPNIVFFFWGNFGCYGGGVLHGAQTPSIDGIAADGLKLLDLRGGPRHAEPLGATNGASSDSLRHSDCTDHGRSGRADSLHAAVASARYASPVMANAPR